MSIFEQATRKQLRFESPQGELTTEQLWELPLTSKSESKANLDSLARMTSRELRSLTEDSFVTLKPDPRKQALELALDVLKRVIEVKLQEKDAALKAAENADRKRRLLAALSRKQDTALEGMSEEQLNAEIAKLEA